MNITSGKIPSAQKVVIYGPEGIGKSQLAALFPDPLFVDVEGSTKHLDVKRLDTPASWTMLMEELAWVQLNPQSCRTLVIDTADWAEQLCVSHVCAVAHVSGIEDFGYGKGYTYLSEEFGNLLNRLSDVVDAGVNVVLTAHTAIRKFEQPDEAAAYDRWELKLGKKTAPLLKEWSDMVLFANYQTFAVTDAKTKKAKAAGGKRVLFTSHTPAFDAKNRHELPAEIPFEGIKALPAELAAAVPAIEMTATPAPKTIAETTDFQATTVDQHNDAATVAKAIGALRGEDVDGPDLAKLHQLMEASDVTEADVRAIVAAKGYFPVTTPLAKYPADFIEGVLVGAWTQVLAGINAARQTELDSVPFN